MSYYSKEGSLGEFQGIRLLLRIISMHICEVPTKSSKNNMKESSMI